MALHLLSLPAEIRNRIYEYALTEDDGVSYREDDSGKGWLCIYEADFGDDDYTVEIPEEPETDDDQSDTHEEPSADESMEYEYFYDGDSMEYELSLIADDMDDEVPVESGRSGLVTNSFGECIVIKDDTYRLANQLQFVCRQLHKETNRLTLRLNKIVFSSPYGGAFEMCVDFLKRLTTKSLRDITAIAIKHHDFYNSPPVPQLVPFCRINPTIQIHVHTGNLYRILSMVGLAYHYGGTYGRHNPFLETLDAGSWNTIYETETPIILPENIRLRFAYGNFDKKDIRDVVEGNMAVQEDILPILQGGLEYFIEIVQKFVQVGF
jgi:hypothetical protein